MSEPEKRRFWQIHLSTAVILAVVSGGLLGLNIRDHAPRNYDGATEDWKINVEILEFRGVKKQFGWPADANEIILDEPMRYSGGLVPIGPHKPKKYPPEPEPRVVWNQTGIHIDCFVAASFLIATAASSEWLIRRREGRKVREKPKRRFWQIHLSTATYSMMLIGVFMYINTIPVWTDYRGNFDEDLLGWPIPYLFRENIYSETLIHRTLMFDGLICDIVFYLTLIYAYSRLSEYLRRRREGRKT